MLLNDLCKHCEKRVFKPESSKRHVHPPKEVGEAWREVFGKKLLGTYYVHTCEICKRKMAVFDRPKGALRGKVIVLYQCSFTDFPYSSECDKFKNCYMCPYSLNKRKSSRRQPQDPNRHTLEGVLKREEEFLKNEDGREDLQKSY